MSALDDAVQQYRSGKQSAARAELTALRATVEAQARQLEEARLFAEYVCDNESSAEDIYKLARAWLAANAPAPQVAYPFSVPDCPCVLAEHPIKPCSLGCFHFTPDDYHDCANCGQPQAQPTQYIAADDDRMFDE